jgi:gluconate 2-dehydrogenase gamma chain
MEGAPRFLNVEEFDTLAAISEAIIPTDDHSPGARDAGVPLYIDAVLTESEDEQRIFWKQGLAAVNRLAEKSYGRRFSACAASQQEELLLKISANEESPATPEERFFVAAKRATIDGYYTSEIGIHKDLEYQGNAMLEEFEGCAHAEHGADEKSP